MQVKLPALLCLFAATSITHAQHPPPTPSYTLLGAFSQSTEIYWLAPYVNTTRIANKYTVTWFDHAGAATHQLQPQDIEPGFVASSNPTQTIIHAVNEPWTITLPHKPGASVYITSTPDSRIFVQESHPSEGSIALDIYLHGKLVRTLAPQLDYLGNGVQLNDDGSLGLLVWKDAAHTTAQAITFDRNGAPNLRVDCGPNVTGLQIAPNGDGVLVSPNPAGENSPNTLWYGPGGISHSLRLWPNPNLIGWLPNTHRSLFETNLGDQPGDYRLIDWDTGRQLWQIPAPHHAHILATGFTEKLILFAAAERYHPGPWRGSGWMRGTDGQEWILTFYAINAQDGSILARWQSNAPARLQDDRFNFLHLGDHIYFLSQTSFTELNLADIGTRRNGWK